MNTDTGPDEFNVGIIDEAEKKGAEDRTRAQEVSQKIDSVVAFLEKVKEASREALERKELQEAIKKAEEFLALYLSDETPVIRRQVRMALMRFELSKPAESIVEAEGIIANLVSKKLLTENKEGILRAYGKGYDAPPESLFGEDEVAKVRQSWKSLLWRVKMAENKQPILTWEEMMAGKPGVVHLDVPSGKDNKGNHLPSGSLRGRSDGTWFIPTRNTLGGIAKSVQEAIALGEEKVRILISSLKDNHPPFFKDTDQAVVGKIWSIWFMMNRARQMQIKDLEFANRATINGAEFSSAKMLGICEIKLQDPWEVWQNVDGLGSKVVRMIHDMFFLAERSQKEDGTYIRVLGVPQHIKEFFTTGHVEEGNEYKEGERYEGCPPLLGAILRAFYRQCARAAGNAAGNAVKAEMIAGA